jgi:hypothetical protein
MGEEIHIGYTAVFFLRIFALPKLTPGAAEKARES